MFGQRGTKEYKIAVCSDLQGCVDTHIHTKILRTFSTGWYDLLEKLKTKPKTK